MLDEIIDKMGDDSLIIFHKFRDLIRNLETMMREINKIKNNIYDQDEMMVKDDEL